MLSKNDEYFGLGQIAYEAYCDATGWENDVICARLLPFEALSKQIQKGWIAAALAIRNEYTG